MSASELKSDLLFYAVVGVAGYALYNKLSGGSVFPSPPRMTIPVDPSQPTVPIDQGAPWGFKELDPVIASWQAFWNRTFGPREPPTGEPGAPIVYDPAQDVPIMWAPDMSKLPEISANVRAYIGRHPALRAADYFAYYPQVAWAEQYLNEQGELPQEIMPGRGEVAPWSAIKNAYLFNPALRYDWVESKGWVGA